MIPRLLRDIPKNSWEGLQMRNTIPMFLHPSSHMRRRWEMPAGIFKALFFVFEGIRVSIVLYFVVQCSELERQQQQPSISALKLRVSKFYRRIEHRYIFQLWWISKDGLFAWFLELFHFHFLSLLSSNTPWKTSCDNFVKDKIQDILWQALLVRADCTGELCDKRATRKYQSILISDNN